jgi:hypothetical protein
MKKTFSLAFLITLLVGGLVLVGPLPFSVVQASTDSSGIPKPFVPEFTVRLVAYPYDVPSTITTKINQYTGEETVTTTPGYHVENRSIDVVIKNQPFTPYTDDWKEINLYYDVRVKGHFGEDWEKLYSDYKSSPEAHPIQSSSEYTILSLPVKYPDGGQVDFQVRAILGYYYDELAGRPILPLYVLGSVGSSDWSDTQTLTINFNEIPEFTSWTILPLFLTATSVVVIYRKRLGQKTAS